MASEKDFESSNDDFKLFGVPYNTTSESSTPHQISDERSSLSRPIIINVLYNKSSHTSRPNYPHPHLPPGASSIPVLQRIEIEHRRQSKRSLMIDSLDYDDSFVELYNSDFQDEKEFLTDSEGKKNARSRLKLFSLRGILNILTLVLLVLVLVTIFGGLPIVFYYQNPSSFRELLSNGGGYNSGGPIGAGHAPVINNIPSPIDPTTPKDVLTRTGFDGKQYDLVFSDEFSTDGRTFWPGDDPYWEAVDLNYWATGDLEWYDPDAITTSNGQLQIKITQEDIQNLKFRSGMLQSWNKFCFTGGYIEVSISLPGTPTVSGFWPGAWTMGNLGRAGYGATTDGTWPYSYASCDVGILRNQTSTSGNGPEAALLADGTSLSYLPGQRLSSCTCSGSDHPGPTVNVGRGAPEIDIIEAQVTAVAGGTKVGQASQSAQFAPFDQAYNWNTEGAILNNTKVSTINSYKGGVYQEAVSVVTMIDQTAYQGSGGNFQKYGFEYTPGASGTITWSISDVPSWTLNAKTAVGPSQATQVSQRLVSEEPMYIILNLGMSETFEAVDLAHLVTPTQMLIDYVRVYQQKGLQNTGCSPENYPTEQYIHEHLNAYTNPNLTTWAQAGYTYPRNTLAGC